MRYLIIVFCSLLTALAQPFDLNSYSLRSWDIYNHLPNYSICGICGIQQSDDGYIWLISKHSLLRFDGLVFQSVPLPKQASIGQNEGIFKDSQGGLWIYGYLGAIRYYNGTWWQSEEHGVPRGRVTSITEARDGTIYFSQEQQLYAWMNNNAKPLFPKSVFADELSKIRQILACSNNRLWLSASNGIWHWTPDSGTTPTPINCIHNEWTLGRDSEQNLIAHGASGSLSYTADGWETLTTNTPLSARCLYTMTDGTLWLGHDTGVSIFKDGIWHNSTLQPGQAPVLSIIQDQEENVWLAASTSLIRLRQRTVLQVPINGASDPAISALWVEPDGNLWAGLNNGNTATGNLAGLNVSANPEQDSVTTPPQSIYRQDDGTHWHNGDDRLWVGQESLGEETLGATMGTDFVSHKDLPTGMIRTIYRDRDGILWIGGQTGLARWDGNQRFVFDTTHGLRNSSIRQISEDATGGLWLGSGAGIMRIKKNNLAAVATGREKWLTVRSFGSESGFTHNPACTGRVFFPQDNPPTDRLWFPTASGLFTIDTRNLSPPRIMPDVKLLSIKAGNRITIQNSTPNWEQLTTKHSDIEIAFAAIDFTSPEQVLYEYELTGPLQRSSDWSPNRKVQFEHLPPGKYNFSIRASNSDGIISANATHCSWYVKPYFWQTLWFKLLCLITGTTTMIVLIRLLERQRLRRRMAVLERRQELTNERSRIARDLHDEIGAQLTRLALLSDMTIEDAADTPNLKDSAEMIAQAARSAHRSFDEIIWSISPRNDTVLRLVNYIRKYTEEFFEKTPVKHHCTVNAPQDNLPLHPRNRHHIFMAFKESLANILKHAQATEVSVNVTVDNQIIQITVTDNGTGFDLQENTKTGEGLANMRERLQDAGGTMQITSSPNTGTKVLFTIPLEKRP